MRNWCFFPRHGELLPIPSWEFCIASLPFLFTTFRRVLFIFLLVFVCTLQAQLLLVRQNQNLYTLSSVSLVDRAQTNFGDSGLDRVPSSYFFHPYLQLTSPTAFCFIGLHDWCGKNLNMENMNEEILRGCIDGARWWGSGVESGDEFISTWIRGKWAEWDKD